MGRRKEKRSVLSNLQSKLLSIDMFGQAAQFDIEGESTYNTCVGSIASILIFLLVVPYAYKKSILMLEMNDTHYSDSTTHGKLLKQHSSAESALTWEDADFSIGVGVLSDDGMMIQNTDEFLDHLELNFRQR